MTSEIEIPHETETPLRAVLDTADNPAALLVLAHGAGAGMRHRFMDALTKQLVTRGMDVLRYEFPYMTQGRKRPDVPAKLVAAVQSAVDFATTDVARAYAGSSVPVFAGGKSLGGRMTSTAAAQGRLKVSGLVFFGFPLHAPGREGIERARHLTDVVAPMLFLQGTRDKLAEITRMREVVSSLRSGDGSRPSARATMVEIEEADHSFHVPKRSGRTDSDVIGFLAETSAAWIRRVAGAS